ncbi:AMP-binding protein [Roseateles toxinivorans]|uniref:D-alanine--poly(Phosphoribitol) ligase subunit 1 n=1 Tax=Roseateles toxinivorans TaxID=270368 RepID=A0A4R6QMP2_9BURK|nr:AMP-binding protein [Roseateles toxinivorans]TDP71390.1 D-alanine--poly(phosphoribitol) ligase subunit 1 [Roseateles toxinivorans]
MTGGQPSPHCHFNLGTAFAEVCSRFVQRTALLYPADQRRVSYGELAELVDVAVGALASRAMPRGGIVALFHDKSPQAFALMLACLRLGLPYVNLDPDSPWERIRRILERCQPALVLNAFPSLACDAQLQAAVAVTPLQDLYRPGAASSSADEPVVSGNMPAYLMFTSGSTGQPKGAVMSHANVLWFIAWARRRFQIGPDDVLSNANPMYFDNSVFDFYAAIFSGATLVPLTSVQVRDARKLVRLVDEAACTLWFSVPSLLVFLLTMRALSAGSWQGMRCIAFGGEGFPKRRLRELFELFGPRARFENVYGPTECTCICSAHRVEATDLDDLHGLAPLGHLAPTFDYRLLPVEGEGPECGELMLLGPQVGLGYYRDPERTAAAFVQNPMQEAYLETGYRTGDIVERDATGRLHFRGRVDHQIKHMGYRIELEEIEAALSSLDGVQECAAIYLKSTDGLGQILAYAVAHGETAGLREALAQLLPAYMLPRHLHFIDALPKNANGKIDRRALLSRAAQGGTPS